MGKKGNIISLSNWKLHPVIVKVCHKQFWDNFWAVLDCYRFTLAKCMFKETLEFIA